MIFQDPFSSLDPRQNAGSIVGESLKIHHLVKDHAEYEKRVDELFRKVGLDPALKERVAHEFSGGQRQRIGIARALSSNPSLIICDEPISALDVSIQAQIINLLEQIQAEMGISYIFIAHDLAVVKHISDRILVMYLGRVMEIAPCEELYEHSLHPYTQALLSAIPVADPEIEENREVTTVQGECPASSSAPAAARSIIAAHNARSAASRKRRSCTRHSPVTSLPATSTGRNNQFRFQSAKSRENRTTH